MEADRPPGAPPLRVERRPLDPEGETFLRALMLRCRRELLFLGGEADATADLVLAMLVDNQRRFYREQFPGDDYQLIFIDGAPGGALFLNRAPGELRVVDIALLPEHRGQGIGGSILRRLLDEARSLGWRVTLSVRPTNPARRLYERLGFQVLSATDVSLEMAWTGADPS